MTKAILARKIGMTQIFDEQGHAVPVTVLEAGPCYVTQVKSVATDGYNSIQIGFKEQKEQRVNRPLLGHYKRSGVKPCRWLREFRLDDLSEYQPGRELRADIFSPGDHVDVSAISRGKGFAGSIKRMGFGRGPRTHGSHYHRGPGSLGAIDPARVFKGRPLPGRMGGRRRTVQNLRVIQADGEKNILLVKGSVPGPQGGLVEVRETTRRKA
ncbi:MAG TPA: 50S ribosomal protein L3 [Bacillota bacterium]|nr:50S ribosomal protein L3 [Bacillota bacterium]HOL16168.1 50S ribosomal protein L3 [Bacillota bacterium]